MHPVLLYHPGGPAPKKLDCFAVEESTEIGDARRRHLPRAVHPREEIARRLPDPIDAIARFGYVTGWRKNEALSLMWSDVDLEHWRIRLRREHSKNGEPRVIVLTDDLLALVQRRWATRQYKTKAGTALSTWCSTGRAGPS